ncbi:hypothetical protein [Nocardioides renjunii]|uniref:hypothetical protein n=1 Tax=Nocardioides renjunii TaxID=3095075 RepID=UPI002B001E2D|nr:hypothetical protein [Nocardioides sp. S-34]WQQ21986.1 hypothetical protein SHK17_19110 [Nocardioides sp. S-34]
MAWDLDWSSVESNDVMLWARLILDYVKALAWPLVVGLIVYAFREKIADKIGDLKDAKTPIGEASFFDREAREVEAKADRAADRQQEGTPPQSDPQAGAGATSKPSGQAEPRDPGSADARKQNERHREFVQREADRRMLTRAWVELREMRYDTAHSIAATAPTAAVMLAYANLERAVRSAWTITKVEEPKTFSITRLVKDLTETGLDAEFWAVSRSLMNLRNKVAHEGAEVSVIGSFDFIGACERLTAALEANATSKLMHPSRNHLTSDLLETMRADGHSRTET